MYWVTSTVTSQWNTLPKSQYYSRIEGELQHTYSMNYIDPRSMVGVDQMLALFDYMKDNPQLAHSRFSRTKEGHSLLKRHWAACADLANNVSPHCTQKTPDQWRAYYNAYKSKIKKKVKYMKTEMAATGGPVKNRLSELENRLYIILGPDLGEQLPRACNTPVSQLQRLEPENQPSSSTAEVLLQNDTNFTIGGSDSSDVELYYPEDDNGHLATVPVGNMGQLASESVVHTDEQLELLVHNVQQLEPVVHNVQQLEPVVRNVQRLEPVVHNVQQLEPVVRNVQRLEPVVHNVQQLEPVVRNVQRLEHMVHTAQQPERVVHINQQLEPGQQPERMVRSGQIKTENVEGSPRRRRRRPSSEQNGDPAIREATDALLNMERMKAETKRHVAAALHRLAGAMEAIAERLGGPIEVQVTSPPRARRRYARISSSESD